MTSSPFTRRLLVVPNPAVKSWLMLQFAKDPEMGIAAGFEILYLPQAIARFTEKITQTIPSRTELLPAIEVEIKKVISAYPSFSENDRCLWDPLLAFLRISPPDPLSRKSERRLVALCEKLASLFTHYGIYGASMVKSWDNSPSCDWQQQLWKNLYHSSGPWSYPAQELLKNPIPPDFPTQMHLFAISFISPAHHAFLAKAAMNLPINYFLLSPCRAFWSDIYSDRERQRMQFKWKQQGLSEAKQIVLEEYLRERNSLLANYGRLGREMAVQIEDSLAQTHEDYELRGGVEGIAQYAEFLDDEPALYQQEGPLSLLEAVQTDMLLLRNPEAQPKINFAYNDDSIQLHIASSPMREVEILYHNLLGLIDKHRTEGNPICPGDIIVMAPDIMLYEPYIKAVFEQAESQLDWQLMDLQIATESSLVRGFLFLLNLSSTRWDASSLLQLFEFPEFQQKHQLSGEDLQHIFTWIKDSGIRWGEDLHHRNEMLARDHCSKRMVEESSIGTWDYGISRLLYGLAVVLDKNEEGADPELLPYPSIDTTQSDLLGKLIALLRSLRDDLQPLSKGIELTLSDWASYLNCLCEAYFTVEPSAQEELIALQKHFNALKQASTHLKEAQFNFISVSRYLNLLLEQETVCYRENHLQAVRFCSMLPMRAIPAKVICLLGMEEGAFPKTDSSLSLNLMKTFPHCDYCPSSTDYDRFLFLEMLLSARKYVLLSFTATNSKEALPSILVTELINYLDSGYTIQGASPSSSRIFTHPFYSFDKVYFSGDSRFRSYSKSQYRAAQAYYQQGKASPPVFIPEFFDGQFVNRLVEERNEILRLDIKLLSDLARNPLKFFFNKTLGLYISSENRRELQNDEDFVLSRLTNGKLRKAALTLPIEQVIALAEKEGALPLGGFKEIAKEQLRQEVLQIQSNLASQGISSQDMIQIELSPHCQQPYQVNNQLWHYPALEINYQSTKIQIVGKLSDVSAKGLIIHGKGDAEDLIKVWPQLLVMQSLFPAGQVLPTKKNQSLSKNIKQPLNALERYVEHYFEAQQTVSFLLPEWVPSLLTEDSKTFAEQVRKSLKNDKFNQNYNDYLLWTFAHTDFPDQLPHFETLRQSAEELFNESL